MLGVFEWGGENFQFTAVDPTLDSGHVLKAQLYDREQNLKSSSIDLAERISNEDGSFQYNG